MRQMLDILSLVLLAASTPTIYQLAPLILVFAFIAAAAGLTKGTDIFQFFGVGALLGIGQGAGAGGAGKGLRSGKTRGKIRAAMVKYDVGSSAGNIKGIVKARAVAYAEKKGGVAATKEIAASVGKATLGGATSQIPGVAGTQVKMELAKRNLELLGTVGMVKMLKDANASSLSKSRVVRGAQRIGRAISTPIQVSRLNRAVNKYEQAHAYAEEQRTKLQTAFNSGNSGLLARAGLRFQLWRYARGEGTALPERFSSTVVPLLWAPFPSPLAGRGIPIPYLPGRGWWVGSRMGHLATEKYWETEMGVRSSILDKLPLGVAAAFQPIITQPTISTSHVISTSKRPFSTRIREYVSTYIKPNLTNPEGLAFYTVSLFTQLRRQSRMPSVELQPETAAYSSASSRFRPPQSPESGYSSFYAIPERNRRPESGYSGFFAAPIASEPPTSGRPPASNGFWAIPQAPPTPPQNTKTRFERFKGYMHEIAGPKKIHKDTGERYTYAELYSEWRESISSKHPLGFDKSLPAYRAFRDKRTAVGQLQKRYKDEKEAADTKEEHEKRFRERYKHIEEDLEERRKRATRKRGRGSSAA